MNRVESVYYQWYTCQLVLTNNYEPEFTKYIVTDNAIDTVVHASAKLFAFLVQ